MTSKMKLIGVYPIEDQKSVYLVELLIENNHKVINIGNFTQEIPGLSQSDWQVPFHEKLLNEEGTKIMVDTLNEKITDELWEGNIRLAFFMYLNPKIPLTTPFGKYAIANIVKIPERLSSIIKFESPE
jgi:hypothetical protein